ncbi:MAG: hypothetical protein CMP24_07260 [Rickettsiales bacterium]|nr:hypothetical protein [Rickettsiales bacterium]
MKNIIILLSFLSLFLTAITFLNLRIDQLDEKLITVKEENVKLEHHLNFLKSEWEYISSPEKIEKLSSKYFKYEIGDIIGKEGLKRLLSISGDKD